MVSSPLVTRAAWGARAPKTTTLMVASEQRGCAIHYSSAESDRVAIHDDCAARVRAIQTYHMDQRDPPFADIAYSWLVCHHGYRFAGRGLGVRTAGQGTNAGNDSYHAICFLGFDNIARDDVTPAAKRAIADCIASVRAEYKQATAVRPHSWFHATGCPGDELRAWITAGLPLPSTATTTGSDLDMTEERLIEILDQRLAAWYRMTAYGKKPDTGEISPAHQRFSLTGIRDALDDQAPA